MADERGGEGVRAETISDTDEEDGTVLVDEEGSERSNGRDSRCPDMVVRGDNAERERENEGENAARKEEGDAIDEEKDDE